MRLSNLADYAVITMCQAALHCGSGSLVDPEHKKRGRVSAAELAAETGLPVPTVQKLVSKLTGAGLLRSVRGAHGGLQLGRPAAAITVADIVEAIEGPIHLTACVDHTPCDFETGCNMKPHWPIINDALRSALAGVSLAQLRNPPAAAGLADRAAAAPKSLTTEEHLA